MQLSVIIVNYNVRFHLEQCLLSVQKATSKIPSEIIVVDNNSTDGSKEYLPAKFPAVKFIFNNENLGFAKACNQGIKNSSGEYVLFLNPDTVLSDDCLKKCIEFFKTHNDAGSVGVRMVNEKGVFLKESKRGFPSPAASFFKLFGLITIFPRSKLFSRYYMGYLAENKNSPVDIISGAFMMVRRNVLEQTGYFDEAFFMYGEDIDISYRIQQAGFQNYYLGEITIQHLKGKSTSFDNTQLNTFYNAMTLFVNKHYTGKKNSIFVWMLLGGVRFRKMIARVDLLCK